MTVKNNSQNTKHRSHDSISIAVARKHARIGHLKKTMDASPPNLVKLLPARAGADHFDTVKFDAPRTTPFAITRHPNNPNWGFAAALTVPAQFP
jgi:hypothetical protein